MQESLLIDVLLCPVDTVLWRKKRKRLIYKLLLARADNRDMKLKNWINMEMIVFMGAQASGKSSFYSSRFFHTHIRVNLDMLKTRNRERILFEACLTARQPFVVDNTNPTRDERARYVSLANEHEFRVSGFYFQSSTKDCIHRNQSRAPFQRVPDLAIRGTIGKLELPMLDEGFELLNFVRIENNEFVVEEWDNEL